MTWRDELRALVEAVQSKELPDLAGELARASALVTLRLNTPRENGAKAPATDRMLTAKQAANILSMSDKWVYRHARELGGTELSPGAVRFSARAIKRYVAGHAKP